jgi:hypothetical protein
VCTDHFARVLVIDPDAAALVAGARAADAFANPPAHARVMQYGTFHSLQGVYYAGAARLFPGAYERELAAAGAVVGSARFNVHVGGHLLDVPMDRLPAPMRTAAGLTRAAHETVLRRLVAADKRIEFVSGTILGFDVDEQDATRLAGVRYRPAGDANAVLSLKGDLVIGLSPPFLSPRCASDSADRLHGRLALGPGAPAARVAGVRAAEEHPRDVPAGDALHVWRVRQRERGPAAVRRGREQLREARAVRRDLRPRGRGDAVARHGARREGPVCVLPALLCLRGLAC